MSQWQIEGAHFGERFQLFVIIALGESIVLAGATASDTGLSIEVVAALLLAFLSSTALWWLYFGQVAGTVLERIRMATLEERGQIGRDIYTYLHLPIVAGIVLVAVADELVIAHPADGLGDAGALVALGGPALFLAGLMPSPPGSATPRAGREPRPWSRCSRPCRSPPAPAGCSSRRCSPGSWLCWW